MRCHRHVPAGRGAGLVAAVLCSLSLLSPAGAGAAVEPRQSPFVFAVGGVWDGVGNPVVAEQLVSGAAAPVRVETGIGSAVFGRFRATMGSNGFVIGVAGGIDREVDGGSLGSDGFSVDGGSGGGQADFFGSADVGITVPAGATLSALSGQPYAAAVPEPAAWALLLLGLGALAARGRRGR